jgi:hypothetical protein
LQLIQSAPAQNGVRPPTLSRETLETFFRKRFADTIAQSYNTVLELILAMGGETLLREHIQWALNYSLPNLQYHKYQEPETNGRVARQLDVAVAVGTRREDLKIIIDQESTRSEVQDGPQLHDSQDLDRITVLYTEYGIALRAVKGLHEPNDSYLDAYRASQVGWRQSASLPVHASSLMQELAGEPFAHGHSLTDLFAEECAGSQPHPSNGVGVPATSNQAPAAGVAP